MGDYIEEAAIQTNKDNFILVGRFLTKNNINFSAMQNVMASLWRPRKRIEIHDLGVYRSSFIFYHIMDLTKYWKDLGRLSKTHWFMTNYWKQMIHRR